MPMKRQAELVERTRDPQDSTVKKRNYRLPWDKLILFKRTTTVHDNELSKLVV